MRVYLNKIKYWLYIIYLSIKHIPLINLGNTVFYNGKRYNVINGVRPKYWTLTDIGDISRESCKLEKSISNFWWSFISSYNFYMINWYSIWVRNGIEDWMKGCNIWGNR